MAGRVADLEAARAGAATPPTAPSGDVGGGTLQAPPVAKAEPPDPAAAAPA
jgi:hypothetical protein